jgi:hypothetical protein
MTITSSGKTRATPETDQRTALIASLRTLANLFEDVPKLPLIQGMEISWSILGSDEEGRRIVEHASRALSEEAVNHRVTDDPNHAIAINIPLVGDYVARAVHVYDRSMAEYRARTSYGPVIQVDEQVAS